MKKHFLVYGVFLAALLTFSGYLIGVQHERHGGGLNITNEAIAAQSDAPTFENTIVPFEKSGSLLTRVDLVFS